MSARPLRCGSALHRRSLELLEESFVYVTASGRRLRRDAYVENGTGPHGLRFQSQEIEGLDVADFGDVGHCDDDPATIGSRSKARR